MKHIVLLLSICLTAFSAKGQNFGNEWINYSQTYYSIPIAEDGVYRITYSDFISAGIQINTVNPNNIKMYAFAEEVPIFIDGVGDGSFNSGDYIEFIGEGNDGRRETVLYENPADHANPDYSLFSDTVRYYITFGNSSGSRFNEVIQNVEDYVPKNFVWHRSEQVFSDTYHDQPQLLDTPPFNNPNFRLSISDFQVGEGWLGPRTTLGNSRDVNLSTLGVYSGPDAPDTASAEMVIVGVSDVNVGGSDHHTQVRYGSQQTIAANLQYDGYRVNRFQFDLPLTALGETETTITHRVLGISGVSRDDQAIAKTSITYPRITDLGGVNEFQFVHYFNTAQSRTRYDFEAISGANPRIYTLGSNPQRIVPVQDGALFKALLANAPDQQPFDCLLVTDASVKTISSISAAGTNGTFTNFGASQVDSAFVIVTHESLMAEAQLYASYRQQKFNTVLVNVDELYDQFGFGSPKSGLAIRNFSNYILQQWSNTPQYLLLLGKSVRSATLGNLAGSRKSVVNSERNLVPSLGYPPSDNYITAGLASTFLEPAIRTGRVSARNPQEVALYRNKLQEFESQPAALWMKNIMHFGGGLNTNEQQRFANYLNGYKNTVEGVEFGGVVHTFLKSNSEPLQINVSEEINTLIEDEGVSLMTFFAHAGSEGFDQSIDNPQNFDWNGKYPFLLGNGCFSGDYHSPNPSSTSEKYTLIENKGVIGFLASVDLGIEGDLNLFSKNFYEQFAEVNYGKSVGNHFRETVRIVQSNLILRQYLCYGMGLQGDPAIVLNSWPKPDLEVSQENIFFTPENITADIDSFSVNIIVNNIGRATDEAFSVTLEHNTPEGVGDSTYTQTLSG
ncbi:MAG TPA: C25 family cysteine peptidase, partial [Cryomorphaceae bacterium]|nr:C25 family cysteine peptidase [Cryomorphaceae bacterium]